MNVRLNRAIASLILTLALASFGCVSPPNEEKKAAEQAVAAAIAAGAEKYASTDFAAATEALKAADSQMGERKYSEARAAYVKAKELAEKAAKGVEAGKATMKAQAEEELGNAEKRWKALEGKVSALAKKLKADQKQAWDADSKAAAEALKAAKAAVADDPASAKDKLVGILSAAEKWETELKAPATRAKKAGGKAERK